MVSSLLDTISITGKKASVKQALHRSEAGHRMTRATRGYPTSSTGCEHDTTSKALRYVSLNPWCIGDIVAAALVLQHFDQARTA
jgi:hypothetical protein